MTVIIIIGVLALIVFAIGNKAWGIKFWDAVLIVIALEFIASIVLTSLGVL